MKKLVLLVCLLSIFTLSACEFDSASLGLPEIELPEIELPEIELPGFIEDIIGGEATDDENNNDDTQNGEETPHVHEYTWTVKQHVKCNVDGIEVGTCECGDTQSRTIEATGHSFVVDAAVEANCENTGLTEGQHCEKCGHVEVAQEVIPYLHGEAVVDDAVAPTCTETGLTEGSHCSLCDAVLVAQEEVEALGHTEEVVPGVAATCTEAGITDGKKCSVCGVTTVEQTEAPALGHAFEYVFATAATCTEAGNVAHRHCSACDLNVAFNGSINLKYDSYYQWAGSETKLFTRTGDGTSGRFEFVYGGNWFVYLVLDSEGRIAYLIQNPANGYGDANNEWYARHSIYADYTTNPAFANLGGSIDQWGNIGFDLVVPTGGFAVMVNAGEVLLEEIFGYYTGSDRDFSHQSLNVDNIRITIDGYDNLHIIHTDAELVVIEDVVVPAGHKVVVDAAVDATCTLPGLTEGSHCSACGEVLVAQEETDAALGHDITSTSYKVEDGVVVKVEECSRCGALESEVATTSIPDALEIGGANEHNVYTTEKYILAGTVTGLYNTQYGNFYIKDAEGKQICIYGLYSADGKTRYDAMSYKPVNGDYVVVYGVLGKYNTTIQMKNGWLLSVNAHEHEPVVDKAVEPTCTKVGLTEGSHCQICDTVLVAQKEIEALGHSYEDGVCTDCGAEEPSQGGEEPVYVEQTHSLSFSNKAQRTEFTTLKQVWEQNGIKLTNNKASSTNNVADYASPARFYQGSNLVIEMENITKIVFTCNSSSYATALKNSIGTVSGATVSVSSSTVTVTFSSAVNSFTIAKLSAQVRMNSMTVTHLVPQA